MNWATKVLRIFISALLCVSLFATGLMAAPDCGARCCCNSITQMQAQHAMPMKIQAPHGCCAGSGPMPCDIQSAQPHELPDAIFSSSSTLNLPAMASLVDQNVVTTAANAGTIANLSETIYQHLCAPPLYLTNLAILA